MLEGLAVTTSYSFMAMTKLAGIIPVNVIGGSSETLRTPLRGFAFSHCMRHGRNWVLTETA